MAARNPVSSSYMHNYQLQGRYMPAHHNVMVRSVACCLDLCAYVHIFYLMPPLHVYFGAMRCLPKSMHMNSKIYTSIKIFQQAAHSSGARHSLSTTHSRKTSGVQHGRVSDLAKKRMGEVSAWASKTQKV